MKRGFTVLKKIIIVRHGRKDGEVIAKDQIAEIEKTGIPGLNELVANNNVIIHMGSKYKRTMQTILAWEKYAEKNGTDCFEYVNEDKNFGNPEIFAAFSTNQAIKDEAGKSNWYNAFMLHDPAFIKRVQSDND